MLWTILKVFYFIAIANNNCIHVSEGDIWILFWKLQGKTSHALSGAESITFSVHKLIQKNAQMTNWSLYITFTMIYYIRQE